MDVESLFGICDSFSKTLRETGADDEVVAEGRSTLYRLRRLTTSLPLAFDDPAMHISEISQDLERMLTNPNYGQTRHHISQSIHVCQSLLSNTENPLEPALRKLALDHAIVVTKDAHMSVAVSEWLDQEFSTSLMRCIAIGELKNITEATRLIYLCSPTYASWKPLGPDWRFARDPRAFESHFIMYPFGQTHIRIQGILPDGKPLRNISSHIPLTVPEFHAVADTQTEWSIEERHISPRNTSATDELVPARYLRLAGNHYTLLDASTDSSVFTVTADASGKLDVQRESIDDLETDRYIVLRVEGTESDFIQQEADRLGAGIHRESQRKWQLALQQARIRDGSLSRVRDRLKDEFGLETTGLADWLNNPRRIGPGNESDFMKLCSYLGLENESTAMWNDLTRIRGYHLQAGTRAAKALRALLEKRDADDPALRDPGFLTIDRGDQGAIGVYRILQIGNEHLVDHSRVGTVEKVTTPNPTTSPEESE